MCITTAQTPARAITAAKSMATVLTWDLNKDFFAFLTALPVGWLLFMNVFSLRAQRFPPQMQLREEG
jgi:hypothetical protein